MKFRITILLTIVIGLFSSTLYAQEVQSDYEIQQTFKEQYANYEQKVENVSSPDSAESLIESIKQFDQNYSKHKELLNKALYPDTYEEQIENLKKSSIRTLNKVETITEQQKQLNKLENQLASYEQDLSQLDQQTDSLKTAIRQSTESEKELSNMVREYRQSLEKRDELILTFIDSMVVTYQNMDLDAFQEIENYDQRSRIKTNDALKLIHDISEENIKILQRNASNLQLDDYMRMAEVNYQFQTMWNKLGDKIHEVYEGDNADMLAENINSNLNEWNNLLQTNTVKAVKEYFAQQGIEADTFESAEELNGALHSYLDKKIKESKDNRSEENYSDLQKFKDFWDRVEVQWTSNLAHANVLSREQTSELNQKVDEWTQIAQPRSNNILVYLLGGSVLLAVALGVMLIRQKKNSGSA
ncbi:hypothetical protein [Fodinibius sp.]|uniref:hypothetical protein n=1 Tax=Fodinibius sp. TaxID=1872440 RepID=UPI002ACEDE5F|nr:hypothetical protein [Fodinibius sp.]MDZ7660208.1 hypothetical protein [Fodinibius sp.]